MRRMRLRGKGPLQKMDVQPKVAATDRCVWCTQKQDKYEIICEYCATCQYCGLVNRSKNACQFCGNRLPEELEHDHEDRYIVVR